MNAKEPEKLNGRLLHRISINDSPICLEQDEVERSDVMIGMKCSFVNDIKSRRRMFAAEAPSFTLYNKAVDKYKGPFPLQKCPNIWNPERHSVEHGLSRTALSSTMSNFNLKDMMKMIEERR